MTVQKMEFKTEVKQLLDLMIHSLYSHKEVFLRELISNASDAIDKARYEALTNAEIQEGEKDWKIKITADSESGILTVSDNGIGMTKDEIVTALGTIAHSGTREFLRLLQERDLKDNPELIGQFGVGFYASFMVADKITVLTRKAGMPGSKAVKWESAADGTFTVEEADKSGKGTDVILHLKNEDKKYLDQWEVRSVVKKYSDFIEHPVVMDIEKEQDSALEKGKKIKVREEETLNSCKALWLRDKAEITADEYNEFYHHVSHDFGDPLKIIHYKAEGTSEFAALLYIPAQAPFNILYQDYKIGPMLYVKRVQIMEHCENLIPPYLRFVKGVVDSSDLPLNVSREILQNNNQVEIIKKNITKKILDLLGEMKNTGYDDYVRFHKEFGRVLKEGIHIDFSRRETIADLMLFQSTMTEADKYTTFEMYVTNMKDGQDDIYYISGPSREEAMKSPHLEAFRHRGYEVLFLLDEVDDLIFGGFEYKGKKMKSVLRGDIHLDKASSDEEQKRFSKLVDFVKDHLKDDVKDVRLSGRLKESACCLVSDEGDLDPRMEKFLKSMGQEVPVGKRILEINPDHPLFEAMNRLFEKEGGSALLAEYSDLLYDQALVMEGSRPKDPAAFSRAMSKLMASALKD
ncbi:MAG TPA: molecular chaperone HtpG [Dissulfurispiraceae bacterium]|nr:molecular chaperone HtpG [Dissulfurispiraceae bacterium]